MVGEVSVTVPPGYDIKKPSALSFHKHLSSLGGAKLSKNQPTENTHDQSSLEAPTTAAFVSRNTLPNQ